MRLLAVPIGLAGVLLLGWALIEAVLSLGFHTRVGQVLLALGALCIVVVPWRLAGTNCQHCNGARSGQMAVADAGAVALQGAELVAGCPGAADLVAGDRGLVSGGRLEPTYDAGIDCDGWHLWLPA